MQPHPFPQAHLDAVLGCEFDSNTVRLSQTLQTRDGRGGRGSASRSCDVASYQARLIPTRRSRPGRMVDGARYAVGVPPGPSADTPGTDVGLNVVVRTLE